MKTCPGCRVVYDDDYNGTCHECGKPLGGVSPNGGGDLQFRYANQVARGRRESGHESAMKAGRYDGVQLPPSLIDVANSFIVVDEEKLREAENAA